LVRRRWAHGGAVDGEAGQIGITVRCTEATDEQQFRADADRDCAAESGILGVKVPRQG